MAVDLRLDRRAAREECLVAREAVSIAAGRALAGRSRVGRSSEQRVEVVQQVFVLARLLCQSLNALPYCGQLIFTVLG